MFNIKYIFSFFISIVFVACVEPIDLEFITTKGLLVIDATLDDTDKDQFVSIKKSLPRNGNDITFSSEENAIVKVIEDNKVSYNCQNVGDGLYYLPLGFKTKSGSTYKLDVELQNGLKYESSQEIMKPTPPIINTKAIYKEEAVEIGNKKVAGHEIYLDTRDNPSKGDFYVWTYRLFEKQSVCKSCYNGIYLTFPAPLGRCLDDQNLRNNIYDYGCASECWEIYESKQLNIMSDTYSSGSEIKNRLITKVPLSTPTGFLIEVSQKNIDARAFRYLKILIEQNQTNGSLADSPPAALVGNIKSLSDPKEIVGGYFMVGNTSTYKLWVPRNEVERYNPIGLLGGRQVNYEPSTLTRPPLANCIKSRTRTPLKPEGWPI